MTGLVRKATMLVACGVLLGATVAMAGVPSPGNSPLPPHFNLVGFNSVTLLADSGAVSNNTLARLTFTVRDLATNPVVGSTVVVDFSGCIVGAPSSKDLTLSNAQHWLGANGTPLSVNCATKRVTGFTDGNGRITMVIEGGGYVSGSPPGMPTAHLAGCAKIYADNVLLGSIGVGMYNLDGATDGIFIPDLSLWAKDFFPPSPATQDRSDYDGDGTVFIPDLSLWASMFFGANSNVAGAACLPL